MAPAGRGGGVSGEAWHARAAGTVAAGGIPAASRHAGIHVPRGPISLHYDTQFIASVPARVMLHCKAIAPTKRSTEKFRATTVAGTIPAEYRKPGIGAKAGPAHGARHRANPFDIRPGGHGNMFLDRGAQTMQGIENMRALTRTRMNTAEHRRQPTT